MLRCTTQVHGGDARRRRKPAGRQAGKLRALTFKNVSFTFEKMPSSSGCCSPSLPAGRPAAGATRRDATRDTDRDVQAHAAASGLGRDATLLEEVGLI